MKSFHYFHPSSLRQMKEYRMTNASSNIYCSQRIGISNFSKQYIPKCYPNSCHFHQSSLFFSSGVHSLFGSPSMQHWFKNWQETRKSKLTASTFGGAIGFWPHRRAQLWLEKLGILKPFVGNIATCWSNIKEEEALRQYKLITGNDVTFPQFHICERNNLKDSWLGASPDGLIECNADGVSTKGILEIKCPYFSDEASRSFPWSSIPYHFIPQAQGIMEIMDRNWMDFYVWTPKGSSLFRLERDKEYWELIKIALSDFWWNHVVPGKELCKNSPIILGTDIDELPLRTQLKCILGSLKPELKSSRPKSKHELFADIVHASKLTVRNSTLLIREINGKLQNRID